MSPINAARRVASILHTHNAHNKNLFILKFAEPPLVDVALNAIVIAAVCVTTRDIQAGEGLRVCYNANPEDGSTFGAGLCRSPNGQPMRMLHTLNKFGVPNTYPVAPACAGDEELEPCPMGNLPMQVVSVPKVSREATPFNIPADYRNMQTMQMRDLQPQLWPMRGDLHTPPPVFK